ncbi:cellulase family glycosylhydrolase [Rhodococcus sp. KRD162]|mgnify:FL=1|uniref:cellulase family glycosylhydrolase n=1 Tax=Rhodococcus sp. KRD162 TaxID=2729725 RepID=UPI001F4A0747|nr:cellulase family glycosylhydrolase [Rhodococcus sp. KRD162]
MALRHRWVPLALTLILAASCSTSIEHERTRELGQLPVSVWDSVRVASNAASTGMPGSDVERDIDAVADIGFTAIRLLVKWSDIESVEGAADWSSIDAEIEWASERNLAVLGVLTWAPTWAVPVEYAHVPHPAPASAARFAQFASAAASRYRDQITAWEVWNEPNVAASYGPSVNPIHYCDVLSASSTAIRAAAPESLVITGPTSPAIDSANDLSPSTFVEALYRCAGAGSFDAVAMHPYSSPQLLSQPTESWSSANEIAAVHSVMERHGDAHKKIWFTEFGAPTTSAGVDEQRQADILVDGITTLTQLPYAGPVFVFDLRDSMTGSAVPDYNYGLMRSDYSPKRALDAVRALVG